MRNANSQPGIRRTADENTDADENGKEAGTRTQEGNPTEEKPEEQTPTAPEPATDPTSGEWTEP